MSASSSSANKSARGAPTGSNRPSFSSPSGQSPGSPLGSLSSARAGGGRAPGGAGRRGKDDHEDLTPPEPLLPSEPVPPPPFEQIRDGWRDPDPATQRQRVVSLLGLPDSLPLTLDSIEADEVFHGLHLAHSLGLDANQTHLLHVLLSELRRQLRTASPTASPGSSLALLSPSEAAAASFAWFRTVLGHLVVKRPAFYPNGAPIPTPLTIDFDALAPLFPPAPPPGAQGSTAASASASSPLRPASSSAFASSSSSSSSPSPPTAHLGHLSSVSPLTAPLSAAQCKAVSDYLSSTLYRHFALYRAAYDPLLVPSRTLQIQPLLLQSPVPDLLSLNHARQVPDDGTLLTPASADQLGAADLAPAAAAASGASEGDALRRLATTRPELAAAVRSAVVEAVRQLEEQRANHAAECEDRLRKARAAVAAAKSTGVR